MSNMTSKDEKGNILVNGMFKVCNVPGNCSGSICHESCIINMIIRRLYELEHRDDESVGDYHER